MGLCVRTCCHVSSLCRLCVFVCWGDCEEEDARHASCPLLGPSHPTDSIIVNFGKGIDPFVSPLPASVVPFHSVG